MIPLFLLKNWRLIAVGALVALLGLWQVRLSHAKHDLSEARAALINPVSHKTWQSEANRADENLGVCRRAIDTQNVALEAVAETGRRHEAMLSDALVVARKTASVATGRAEAILKLRPAGADACAQLVDLDKRLSEGVR